VLVGSPAGPILAYYFMARGLPTEPLDRPIETARRAIIVSNETEAFAQSRFEVMRYYGLSGGWLLDVRVLRQYPGGTLYEAVNPG
jgi:hypothetical protein